MTRKLARRTKVIGYIRVSTDLQADEGVSLDAQREKLQQYASLFDLDLVGVHVDAGLSAKTLDRPGLQAALEDLKQGRAEGIVVVKLDRLTRSVRDLGTLVESYFAPGMFALLSVGEQIDTRSAAGRLMLNILASVSQWEREAIGERTRDALAHLKAKGVKVGRAGLGWRRAEDSDENGYRALQPIEDEQVTVDRILQLRGEGQSYARIAEILAREGRPTKAGKRWFPATVRRIAVRLQSAESTA